MLRQFVTFVLFISASYAWAGPSGSTDICAVRPDLCGSGGKGKTHARRRVPVARVQHARCRPYDQPIDGNNFDLPECKSVSRQPASETQADGITFQDYMKFNANDPALHRPIPDEETAFVDAPPAVSYEATQDATLTAPGANGVNPASFDPPGGGFGGAGRAPSSFGGAGGGSFNNAGAGGFNGAGANGGSSGLNSNGAQNFGNSGAGGGGFGNSGSSANTMGGAGGGSQLNPTGGGGEAGAAH